MKKEIEITVNYRIFRTNDLKNIWKNVQKKDTDDKITSTNSFDRNCVRTKIMTIHRVIPYPVEATKGPCGVQDSM